MFVIVTGEFIDQINMCVYHAQKELRCNSRCGDYSGYSTGRTVGGKTAGRSKRLFCSPASPARIWGPATLPFNEYRSSLSGVKRQGRGVHHLPPSTAEVE